MELRAWLWQALRQVMLHGAYSNLYLKEHLNELNPKDRPLATRIFYGTLQNARYCEAVWRRFAKGRVSGAVSVLLTFTMYQILFLDKVPAYAAVDDAVKLASRKSKKTGDFVNAILHKALENPMELPENPVERLALSTSLPEWLIKMWISQYGEEAAREMALASVSTLPVYVRLNPMRMGIEEALEAGLKPASDLEEPMDALFRYDESTLEQNPLYLEGKISVQDPGSYAIADLASPREGDQVLDVCAAPGTKTIAMAEMMEGKGNIMALDLHPHRAALIEKDAARTGYDTMIQAEARDSTDLAGLPEYDVVLCDVPCSGYGVLARKPDMKLSLDPGTMDTLIPLQKKILEQAGEHTKEKGRLVYSTCTLNKKENEKQVQAFLKDHPDFTLEEEKTIFPTSEHNGFYMALLRRDA